MELVQTPEVDSAKQRKSMYQPGERVAVIESDDARREQYISDSRGRGATTLQAFTNMAEGLAALIQDPKIQTVVLGSSYHSRRDAIEWIRNYRA